MITELDFIDLTARHLSQESCQKWGYGIGTWKDQKVQVAQYRNSNGSTVAQKVRTKDKDFLILGDAKQMELYGQHLWAKGGKRVVITEGEIDAISLSQVQGHKWPVVSLPNGASSASRACKNSLEWLESFDEVVLAFDMDDPGRKAMEDCAPLFKPGRCKLWEIPLKDANEMLVDGRVAELTAAVWQARTYQPGGILSGEDITVESLQEASSPGFQLPYRELSEKLHGLRKAELTLLTAGSGIGKSTLAREIGYYLRSQYGHKIGNIYLEEKHTKTAQGYIAIDNNVSLGALRENPKLLTPEQWAESKAKVIDGGMYFYQHFGSLETDELFCKLKYLATGVGVDWIILDHISIIVSGLTSESGEGERKDIDILMTRLRSLVEETGVGIIAITHLSQPKDGKAHEEGSAVHLSQLRGSGSLKQLSDNVVAMERNQQGKDSEISKFRVLKNREWGDTGEAGFCAYRSKTGRLEHLDKVFAEKFLESKPTPEGGAY